MPPAGQDTPTFLHDIYSIGSVSVSFANVLFYKSGPYLVQSVIGGLHSFAYLKENLWTLEKLLTFQMS